MKDAEKQVIPPSPKTVILPLIIIIITVVILILISFLGISGIGPRDLFGGGMRQYNYEYMMMDTFVTISLFTDAGKEHAGEAAQKTFEEMERLESLLHRNTPGSDIRKINDNAGIAPVIVDAETFFIISKAIEYGELSCGAFDISIAPLIDLWGFGSEDITVPEPEAIRESRQHIDYQKIKTDPLSRSVSIEEGMALDLGGIAKGYIVDRGIDTLKENGIGRAFLNAGGDIRLIGGKPGPEPWNVGIQNPRQEDGSRGIAGKIALFDSAVVTSGDYQRFFEEDGRRYHHIIDPATGYPADRLLSVTIVHDQALDADILSTAVFVMGKERGLKLIEELPGTEAVIITPELEIINTAGLEGKFEKIP